jgi:hypothetical protein
MATRAVPRSQRHLRDPNFSYRCHPAAEPVAMGYARQAPMELVPDMEPAAEMRRQFAPDATTPARHRGRL